MKKGAAKMETKKQVVTGAFGYLGKYIAEELVKDGQKVSTLTGHPRRRDPFNNKVEAMPYDFTRPGAIVERLKDTDTLFNTYWVRFNHGDQTFGQAVARTQNMVRAARRAGVRRIVHISITNPHLESSLPYFRGKAVLEETIKRSGLSYTIIRPTVFFGGEDILINNIAWLLRRFPVFGMFGNGDYRLQPVYVKDVARLAVRLGKEDHDITIDAVGPETYTFRELVNMVREATGSRSAIIPLPSLVAYLAGKIMGPFVNDVIITRQEMAGLMEGLLVSWEGPSCSTRFSDWLSEHSMELGRSYRSELKRHFK